MRRPAAVCLQPRRDLCTEFLLCLLFILRLPQVMPSGLWGPGMRPARTSVPKGAWGWWRGVSCEYVISFRFFAVLEGRTAQGQLLFTVVHTGLSDAGRELDGVQRGEGNTSGLRT